MKSDFIVPYKLTMTGEIIVTAASYDLAKKKLEEMWEASGSEAFINESYDSNLDLDI